jgi:hypothetical protein
MSICKKIYSIFRLVPGWGSNVEYFHINLLKILLIPTYIIYFMNIDTMDHRDGYLSDSHLFAEKYSVKLFSQKEKLCSDVPFLRVDFRLNKHRFVK